MKTLAKKKAVWTVQRKEHRQDLARMLRATLIQLHNGWCDVCHKDRNDLGDGMLQFAHIHGMKTGVSGSGRGQYYRLKDVFDYPDSYVLLCEEHHLEYDQEKRPVKEIG